MFFRSKVLRLSFLLAALACGSDSSGKSPTDPLNLNGNPGLLTNGTFTATINGTKWSATGQAVVTRTAGNGIGIAGVSPAMRSPSDSPMSPRQERSSSPRALAPSRSQWSVPRMEWAGEPDRRPASEAGRST